MSKELLITLPKRGIKIVPFPETIEKMERARRGERVGPWSEEEKLRLKLLTRCGILENRYSTPEEGKEFMKVVDYERRKELLGMACELTDCIIDKWGIINPGKNIAVVLFGSIAKGLVKKSDHSDPSNIDLTVIGMFSPEEKELLFNEIRPKRTEIQERILKDCPNAADRAGLCVGNAGVHIQCPEKLIKNNYSGALEYIKSKATPLYDPSGIWRNLEKEALDFYKNKGTTS